MGKFSIPKVSSEELHNRYERIKPIVQIGDTKYFLREFTDGELSGIAYLWNADEDKREPVDMSQYTYNKENDFTCLHTYGYVGFFKPSIAEVLAQIPENLINEVDVFEIIASPGNVEDLNKRAEATQAGYHVSTVRLYTKVS